MTRRIFTLFSFLMLMNVTAQAANVTFQVDMTQVTENFLLPEVNGTFNNWCGACAIMTDANADGIWDITIDLEPGTYEYKFAADGWNIQESLSQGSPCTITQGGFTNRVITVGAEDVTLDPVCWGSCLACGVAAQTYDITFRVDMAEVVEAYTTPEVNGTFNGWCGGCAPMTNVGGTIWEITIPLEPGNYEFKFAADNWNIQEALTVGSLCTVTVGPFTNRVFSVVDQDLDLGTVCWGSCEACDAEVSFYDVTFRVDMSNVTEVFTTPEVNGTFNEWCGGCAPMTNVGNNIWELTIALAPGNYQFKYAADGWNIQEELTSGDPCTITLDGFTNRTVTVTNQPINLGTVCWASCLNCDGGNGGDDCEFETILAFDDVTSLNGWQALEDATNAQEAAFGWSVNGGVTTGALLISGNNQSAGIGKAFIFDYLDPNFDYQGASAVFLSFDVKLLAPLVGSAFHLQTEFPGVGVTNNFDLQTSGLSETEWTDFNFSFDGVTEGNLFRIHFNLAAGAFVGAGGQILIDNIRISCIENTGNDIEGCTNPNATNYDPAATLDNGSCLFNVTFRVDMSEVTEAFTTPEVNGTFNEWCGGCAPMTNIGGNVWELIIPLPAGGYQFKYAADAWEIQEELTSGSACTVTLDGFTNRTVTVANSSIDLGTVCWGACTACDVVIPTYNVTFKVDMSEVTDAFTTPEVNGTFNAFCGSCAPMADADTDGVWELVIALEPGTYEYKFSADNWNIQEELTSGDACTTTIDGFTNRTLTVTDSDIVLDEVCWSSCMACIVGTEEIAALVAAIYPNPVQADVVNVRVNDGSAVQFIQIYDARGALVRQDQVLNQSNTLTVPVSELANGVYTLMVVSNAAASSHAIVIQR